MKSKQKECFTPHVMMHSVFGLGLGFILASFLNALPLLWIGVILVVGAFVVDWMRK